ncbi:MAG: hypothetical protein EOO88_28135, partial [Pedobacter sp.]
MFSSEGKKKRERIIALDLLRGAFLVTIFINHIAWSPTLFDFITGQSRLFASAAEGFFVISGILVGYIYGPRVLKQTKSTFMRLFRRAGWLYLLAISFTTLYTVITLFLPLDTVRSQYLHPTLFDFLFNTLTLQFNYGWADFLSRYAVLMAVAPLIVWLIAKGKAWLVAAASFLIWLLLRDSAISHITAWQIIFFGGIMIGYYLPSIEKAAQNITIKWRKIAWVSLVTFTLVTFTLNIIVAVLLPIIAGKLESLVSPGLYSTILAVIDTRTMLDISVFSRESLEIGRLAIGVIWFTTLYILFRKNEDKINTWTKGSLLLLGTNSLYVYGLQSFILFMMDIFFDPPEGASFLLKTLITANAVYIVYVLTKHRVRIRGYRK